jgi:hypothetical protein
VLIANTILYFEEIGKMKKQRFLFALAMVAMVAVTANADFTWSGGTGDWFDGTQWDGGASPGRYPSQNITVSAGSIVNTLDTNILDLRGGLHFQLDGTASLDWDADGSHMYVGSNWAANGGATMTIAGDATLTLYSSSNPGGRGNLEIGNNVDGILYVEGGTINMLNNDLKLSGGSTGDGELHISGGTINARHVNNGWDGQGVVRIFGGGADINISGDYKNNGTSQTQWYVEADGVSTIDAGTFQMNGGALVGRTNGYTGTWTLATYDSKTGSLALGSNFIMVGMLAGQTASLDYGANALTLTVIPEPATLALLGLGGLVLRRRKK